MANEQADYNQRFLTQVSQRCDTKVIDLVYGYVKNADVYIPNEVALLCLAYYYIDEHFTIAHANYNIVNSRKEIKFARNGDFGLYGSAFGNVLIHSDLGGIYIWKFKIICVTMHTNASIGISTEYTRTIRVFDANRDGHNYGLSGCGEVYNNVRKVFSINSDHVFKSGDILTMTLDLNNKTLKYEHQDGIYAHQGFNVIACGPDIRYKMAISLSEIDEQIQLIDFWNDES